jgi:HlyD family secretion protein
MSARSYGAAGRWVVVALLIVALSATAFAIFRRRSGPRLERTSVERIVQGNFRREVTGTGAVEAATERNLVFRSAGTIAEILVREGDTVESETALARLDTAGLERDLASSRASLQSARADLSRVTAQQQVDRLDAESSVASARDTLANAQQSLTEAQSNLAVVSRLFETGAASQNELTTAQDTVASSERRVAQAELTLQSALTRQGSFDQLAQAQVASSQAQISQLETTIANLEERIADATMRAPFAGTVARISFAVGDEVSPTAQSSIQLIDTGTLFVTANFDENRAAELRVGQVASIVPDASANRAFPARVQRVSAVADRANNAAQLRVELQFENTPPSDLIRPGFTVTARVTVSSAEDVLLIPLEAISEEDGESYVYKVNSAEAGQGTVERAMLRIIDRNATVAAAESDTLNARDLIAVINLERLEPGVTVTFTPPAGGL